MTRTNAYLSISLGNAILFGFVAMLIHPLLAIPVALTVFGGTFLALCLATGP